MKSSKIFYWYVKSLSFALVLLSVTLIFGVLMKEEISFKLLYTIFPLLLFSCATVFVFVIIDRKLTLVELNAYGIVSEEIKISWTEVNKITFTVVGMYRVSYKSGWFLLSPATMPRFIFAMNLNHDEFNFFIEAKKKAL